MENTLQYKQAKMWQLVFFALLQAAANTFMLLMNFSSYIATGLYGVAVVAMSLLLTCTRLWDAVTDPIVGFIQDHINTRFGRFRPMLIIGYLVMAVSTLVMFFFGKGGAVMFTLMYVIYIIGYTIVNVAYKAAIPIMTNDPRQRPLIGRFQAFFTVTLSTFFTIYLSKYLAVKHGGINPGALQEMLITALIVAGVAYLLGVVALAECDKPEAINALPVSAQPKLRDCWAAIKGNRPLQMLIVAAATDKLAMQTAGNSSISIMLFGIIIGNYAFNGSMSLYAYLPSLVFIVLITRYARKLGSKTALLGFSWLGIVLSAATILFLALIDPTQISVAAVPTLVFVLLTILRLAVVQANASLTNIMVADCADYELYRSGKFMPGLVSTVFSFVDKLFSSLSTTIVGLAVAAIGYTQALPAIGDPSTPALFWVTMLLALGMPMLGWLCSVVALKFYDLSPEKMAEVQKHNAELRAKNAAAGTEKA